MGTNTNTNAQTDVNKFVQEKKDEGTFISVDRFPDYYIVYFYDKNKNRRKEKKFIISDISEQKKMNMRNYIRQLLLESSLPPFLYHATYKPLLQSIQQEGLGGTSSNPNYEDSVKGVVYLAYDPNVAESYAETSDMVDESWLDEIIILQIDTSGINPDKLFRDQNVRNDDETTLEYHGVIPWQYITVLGR